MNCKAITTKLKAIREKKDLFESELEKGNIDCLKIKSDLISKVEGLILESWPIEFSVEKLRETLNQHKMLFEQSGIVRDGKIVKDLLPNELKEEIFTMLTEKQLCEFLITKKEQVNKMIKLGLTELIIVPIAADFGTDEELTMGTHVYTGLLDILADEIRIKAKHLKNSKGNSLHSEVDLKCPIHVNSIFKDMRYTFKEKDGTFSEGLTHTQFIEKHRVAASPFPGFAIYFKEKGNLLLPGRDNDSPLKDFTVNQNVHHYIKCLHKLGLTGTTAHAELIILLNSIQKEGKITRDYMSDVVTFICGNTFSYTASIARCFWANFGRFSFYGEHPDNTYDNAIAAPIGELI